MSHSNQFGARTSATPYILTENTMPGIVSLLFYKTSTGKALSNLAETLLLGPSPLSSADREFIASYVSWLNRCDFCHTSHSAAAVCHSAENSTHIEAYKKDPEQMQISTKLKALLKIAAQVQQSGRNVEPEHIENARKAGATDEELHDTVLIAAAFCMYNRYVDGLNTPLPESRDEYKEMGERMRKGYKLPPFFIRWFIRRSERKKALALSRT
ncbi:MAG: carboxymuconolactone decarboxylase family protein [Bacteroidetes bacterium]|nr:carboxymuconolactone decarboxylase family protein [Bacteroidota bacterium]